MRTTIINDIINYYRRIIFGLKLKLIIIFSLTNQIKYNYSQEGIIFLYFLIHDPIYYVKKS